MLLFEATHGADDPERANLPFIRANVAAAMGQDAAVHLVGDAVWMATIEGGRHVRYGVPMEPQVFDVLAYLATRPGRMITKEELLDEIWGDRFVSPSALNSRIKSARAATGDDGKRQEVIRTVHGRGFMFVAERE